MEQILFYISMGLFICIFILLVVLNVRKMVLAKRNKKQIIVTDNTRYTTTKEPVKEQGDVNITYDKKDIILPANKTLIIGDKNSIMPGKYTMLSISEDIPEFAIRLNGIITNHKHNSNIVFAEGDVVCATTHNVILR